MLGLDGRRQVAPTGDQTVWGSSQHRGEAQVAAGPHSTWVVEYRWDSVEGSRKDQVQPPRASPGGAGAAAAGASVGDGPLGSMTPFPYQLTGDVPAPSLPRESQRSVHVCPDPETAGWRSAVAPLVMWLLLTHAHDFGHAGVEASTVWTLTALWIPNGAFVLISAA